MLIEQFKPIRNYEGLYEISNWGNIRTLLYSKKLGDPPHLLRTASNSHGYVCGILTKDKIPTSFKIHHLVWDHFGDKPRNGHKLQIDHIDGNKTNNFIGNLRLLSNRDNITAWHRKNRLNKIPTGVQFIKDINKYQSRICINYKFISLGYYDNINDASLAYQNKLKSINKGAK